ncbi:hypothetical protein DSO57_1010178 [Entomophthora muscae]|uniref:Uncharacterized protein n=1 Tax=Entomophthora muscae TaxID=34485 RepID=A0ACC2UT71_9FUNG|nr:hypothetical protein DSO57_1010178 [Entomophthora muscae]
MGQHSQYQLVGAQSQKGAGGPAVHKPSGPRGSRVRVQFLLLGPGFQRGRIVNPERELQRYNIHGKVFQWLMTVYPIVIALTGFQIANLLPYLAQVVSTCLGITLTPDPYGFDLFNSHMVSSSAPDPIPIPTQAASQSTNKDDKLDLEQLPATGQPALSQPIRLQLLQPSVPGN